MSSLPARGYFGISEVLAQLRPEFSDISVSKIRFLETEGLISPARSPAGYRRFSATDVDRLRYILTAQRDQYLPLRVIRERLDRPGDESGSPAPAWNRQRSGRGAEPPGWAAGRTAGQPDPVAAAAGRGDASERLLTRRELVDAVGTSDAVLTELETFGLLRKVGRQYGADAAQVASLAVALAAYGVEARHLRAVRAAADREATMIENLVAPIQRQRGAGARELASRTADEVAGLVNLLHRALLGGALAEAGLDRAGPGEAAEAADSQPGRAPVRQVAGGVGGASA
jgi:DNA-binding transcriptional MerR regulator